MFHRKRQQGFLIPLAAIIVVGLGILSLAIARLSSQANESSVLEGLSAQAFYAAESGAYYGLNQLIYDETIRTTVDSNCTGISTTLNFSTAGLSSCSTTVSCSCSGACLGSGTVSYYTINSAASCGAGNLVAQRTVEVASFFE